MTDLGETKVCTSADDSSQTVGSLHFKAPPYMPAVSRHWTDCGRPAGVAVPSAGMPNYRGQSSRSLQCKRLQLAQTAKDHVDDAYT